MSAEKNLAKKIMTIFVDVPFIYFYCPHLFLTEEMGAAVFALNNNNNNSNNNNNNNNNNNDIYFYLGA